ncbi:protein FAM177A1 [Sinocyclocheilus grahami]|uniref:protein FAM177A1 n=1 Tax=Sinocyclocheilus grahami TaxID=75366 RepID=UPI0007AD3485|nr:PREDICTED: protein FAM177A1-like [Sinocyclocheilus grahami]
MHTDEPLRDVSPRQVKVIHFSSGETLTEEDCEEEEAQHQLHQAPSVSDPGTWTWKDYSRFWGTQILRKSLTFCDFLGEKMAGLLGLNAAKYQYAVDQYQREHKVAICDFLGEKMAGLLGLNAAKYQYAVDQYQREHKNETEGEVLIEEEEIINLSKIASKQYGATNVQDPTQQTLEETLRYKGEQNQGSRIQDLKKK